MAINFGVVAIVVGGLFLVSKMGRDETPELSPTESFEQRREESGIDFFGTFPFDPDEGAELEASVDAFSLDFSTEPFEFAPFLFPELSPTESFEQRREESGIDFFGTFPFDPDEGVELQAQLADEARRQAEAEAAALPRQRQFYIDDLVGRLGVPESFFAGTIAGDTADEIVLNYNAIYESYLLQLEQQSGQLAEAQRLATLQADLTAQLREGGIAGTPTGNTEDELRASAQALIDQQTQATVQRLQAQLASRLAEQEAAAALQQQLAAAALQQQLATADPFGVEESAFFFTAPEPELIQPVLSPIESFEERRVESGIDFFGTFAFDPDEF